MFQTEPILYLQSMGTHWFTYLIILITETGSSLFLVFIVVTIMFGVDIKKGILLLQLLMWTGLITQMLKILVAFPRPDFVDNRVLNLEWGIKNTSPFIGNGSKGIFAFPDNQTLTAFRSQDAFARSGFGFPSAHVALTTSLWGGMATVFKSRIIRILTPLAIVIMAFTRLYLGRHFIADVLGGAFVGLIFLIAFNLFSRSSLKGDLFKKDSYKLAFRKQNLFFYFFMFVVPVILTALSLVTSDVAGLFLGSNVAYLLILRTGIPDDNAGITNKTTRVFIAILLLLVSSVMLDMLFKTTVPINYLRFTLTGFLQTFIPASTIWVSVVVCKKLGLYSKDSFL